MKPKITSLQQLAERYRVDDPRRFKLKSVDPDDTGTIEKDDKEIAELMLTETRARMSELQDKLYAQDRHSVLLIFQAMDAAGKDGTIHHVMSGVNPIGCQIASFKAPSAEELDHDFLWRAARKLPERGMIGIFNRSYYEEVLVVRVHPEILEAQRLPAELVGKDIWKQRFQQINAFEDYLHHNGTVIRKFFLHVSRGEQRRRFLKRLDEPEKNWKFALTDVRERRFWPQYMDAYQEMLRHTSTPAAPWYVIPADNKWYTRLMVATVLIETLADLDLRYPTVDRSRRRELVKARAELMRDEKQSHR